MHEIALVHLCLDNHVDEILWVSFLTFIDTSTQQTSCPSGIYNAYASFSRTSQFWVQLYCRCVLCDWPLQLHILIGYGIL